MAWKRIPKTPNLPSFFVKACIHAKAFYVAGVSGKNSLASSSPLTGGWVKFQLHTPNPNEISAGLGTEMDEINKLTE